MIGLDHGLLILAGALLLDALVGDPPALWRRLPHPVVLAGRVVALLDARLNRDADPFARRKRLGVVAVALLVAAAAALGLAIQATLLAIPFGEVGIVVVAAILLAQNGLARHVLAVADALDSGGIAAGRRAVAAIVGRNPDALDTAGVSRAAVESVAENFSDAVVAPALWFALLGLPGLFAYKAINTADSMIGHRSERHEAFGWAAARLDDLVNLPASRLAGLLIALAARLGGGRTGTAFRLMLTDARRHRSPNAGWPEAAMAGALGLALAGPRQYGEHMVFDPFLNAAGRGEADAADIRNAVRIVWGAWAVLATAVAALAAIA